MSHLTAWANAPSESNAFPTTQQKSPPTLKIRKKRPFTNQTPQSPESDSIPSSRASSASISSKKQFLRNRRKFLDGRFTLTKKARLTQDMTIDDFLFLPSLSDVSERIYREELELQEKERLEMEKEIAIDIEARMDASRHRKRREKIKRAAVMNERGLPTTMPSGMAMLHQNRKASKKTTNVARSSSRLSSNSAPREDTLSEKASRSSPSRVFESKLQSQAETALSSTSDDAHSVTMNESAGFAMGEHSMSAIDVTYEDSLDSESIVKIPLRAKQRIQSLNLLSNLPSHLKQEIAQQLVEQGDEDEVTNPIYTDLQNASAHLRKKYMQKLQKRKFNDPLQKKISKQIRQAMDERHPTKNTHHRQFKLPLGAFGVEDGAPAAQHSENYRRSRAMRYADNATSQHHSGVPFVRIPHGSISISQPSLPMRSIKSTTKAILKQYLDGETPPLRNVMGVDMGEKSHSRSRPKLVLLQNDGSALKRPHTVGFRKRDRNAELKSIDPKRFKELRYKDKDFAKVCTTAMSKVEAHYRVERRSKLHFGDVL